MAVIMVHSLARANVESLLDEDVAEPETTTPPPPPPGNSPDIRHQIITLSTTAILIQVLVILAILIGLILFCWFRRRAKRRRGKPNSSTDESKTEQDMNAHIGYRATILGLPSRSRKKFTDDLAPSKPDRRSNEQEGRAIPRSELPDESTLRSGDSSTKEISRTSVFVVSPRTNSWLKGTSHISYTPEMPATPAKTHETLDSPPSLADIHERLTKVDHEMPEAPPPAVFNNDESRWSGTTRSSVFTDFSSRSSGAAYYSSLRPPPLSRQTHMEPLPELTHTVLGETPMHRPQTMGGDRD